MPDYSLLAQALSRQDGLAPYGMRNLEQGQNITQGTIKGKGYFGEIPMNQGGAGGQARLPDQAPKEIYRHTDGSGESGLSPKELVKFNTLEL